MARVGRAEAKARHRKARHGTYHEVARRLAGRIGLAGAVVRRPVLAFCGRGAELDRAGLRRGAVRYISYTEERTSHEGNVPCGRLAVRGGGQKEEHWAYGADVRADQP